MTDAPRKLAEDEGLGAFLDHALLLAGMAIDPEWREGILAHLEAIAAAAELVNGFALDDHVEEAPVFSA
jgi:hypothetical protein